MSEWQPIETCALNEIVLIYDNNLQYSIVVGCKTESVDGTFYYSDVIDGYPYNPTHWMPLPEPPK